MGNVEVAELLKIANRHLPRVRLEYNRLREEKRLLEAELNSWKVEVSSAARTYQQFCDRNLALKNREDELQLSINDLEIKETELQKSITGLKQQIPILMESKADNTSLNPTVISKNDILNSLPDNTISYQNDNGIFPHHSQDEPSARTE
jgi:chromosome segregation ATPase